jgi:AcrR family transcriptional regulator
MHSRTDILNTAGDLFSEHGYHGTTMRDLAKALDLRGASLYSHIKSKEEMLWEIVNRAADQFQAQAEAIPQDIPVEEQLKRLVKGHLEVIANELPYAITFFHEWKFLTPELRDQVKERRDSHEAHFRRVIEEGMRQGVFHVEDPHLATLFVLSALNGTYQWFHLDGPLSIDEVADRYITLILSALNAHR